MRIPLRKLPLVLVEVSLLLIAAKTLQTAHKMCVHRIEVILNGRNSQKR